jgi:hypothetical protein
MDLAEVVQKLICSVTEVRGGDNQIRTREETLQGQAEGTPIKGTQISGDMGIGQGDWPLTPSEIGYQ